MEARTFFGQAEVNYSNTINSSASLSSFATAAEHHSSSPETPHSMAAPSARPKRKRATKDDYKSWNELTKVLVGPDEEPFSIHTRVIRKVPFFRGCLDANMAERAEGVVKLPEDDPGRSHIFYTGCTMMNCQCISY